MNVIDLTKISLAYLCYWCHLSLMSLEQILYHDQLINIENDFFSRESDSTTTNVRSFVRSSVSLSVTKTPKQHKINHSTIPLPSTPSHTITSTTSHTITHTTTHNNNIKHTIGTPSCTSHTPSFTQPFIQTFTTPQSNHHHHLLIERLLSFSACFFLKASLSLSGHVG